MSELFSIVGHLAGVAENCLVWGKTSTRLVISSEVFFLKVKKDAVGKNWIFPYTEGKLGFSFTDSNKVGIVM